MLSKNIADKLLNYEDKIQETPIVWATAKGNHGLVRIFLNNGCKLGVNFENETLLHTAAQLGKCPCKFLNILHNQLGLNAYNFFPREFGIC